MTITAGTNNETSSLETSERIMELDGTSRQPVLKVPCFGEADVYMWLINISDPTKRVEAMNNLCQYREYVTDLAVLLWKTFGVVSGLIQEITNAAFCHGVSIVTAVRVINALKLLECLAEHPNTKIHFVCSNLHELVRMFAQSKEISNAAEAFRERALRILCALASVNSRRMSSRLRSAQLERDCVIAQLADSEFLEPILRNTVAFGGQRCLFCLVDLLLEIFSSDVVRFLFIEDPANYQMLKDVFRNLEARLPKNAPEYNLKLEKVKEWVFVKKESEL